MLHRKIEGGYIIGDEYGQVKQILIVRFVCLRAWGCTSSPGSQACKPLFFLTFAEVALDEADIFYFFESCEEAL